MRSRVYYFFLLMVVLSGCKNKHLFESIDSGHSGIDFKNIIQDNDTLNVLDVENIYNGGGVAIADFNNDGLQDVYLSGNTVSNKLYLNKGDFRFEDITTNAGVDGEGKWSRGVSVVDINNDGLMDLYVCATLTPDAGKRANILYINQGKKEGGIPFFKNMAKEYGLNDSSHSTMAAFFDYDNDNDLDMYLLVNQIIKNEYPNNFRPVLKNGEHPSTGRLYRNDWSEPLRHPVFTNVSKEAGITIEGYGHGVNITDINQDGWKDIYVTNDFLSNNILYINNGNGTFTDKVFDYFKHTAANSMGQDVQDINNDGLQDIIELDMFPQDNYRKKMMLNANSYQTYQNSDYYGYQYQYVRNTLQLNLGPRVNSSDSIGEPIFSDIGFYSGIAETDWSWAPLVGDFDNDGYRDIIATNGFPKDVTDHDFIAFRNKASLIASKRELLDQIPQVKLHNYAFRNNGDLTFANVSKEWNTGEASFSSGAAYADLDNDGDLDYIVNNINDEAFLFRNNNPKEDHHYLRFSFSGNQQNKNGIGAWLYLYYDNGKQQVYENTPYRGYLSSVEQGAHFGLGKVTEVDSVLVKWPDGSKEIIQKLKVDQNVTLDIKNAKSSTSSQRNLVAGNTLFTDVTNLLGVQYTHQERDFIDFNLQKLLPHKFSEYPPGLAVGDLDGNGSDDILIGGSTGNSPVMLLQMRDGKFVSKDVVPGSNADTKKSEDLGVLLFDVDSDNDLDLYTASGGYEAIPGNNAYTDKLYINNGKADFHLDSSALPLNLTSKSCVRAADFDRDGDLDLFIAGRVLPTQYPKPVSSFIYRNDTKEGVIRFTNVTSSIANVLDSIGLICDATWTDFDNDGWLDLILAGEWMPVTFIKNEKGVFKNITSQTGIANKKGWWTSIVPADFDNDGDMDYIAGNLGLNSFYKGNEKYPVRIYAKDFDNNGSYDAVPSLYLPVSHENPELKQFPVHMRDDMVKQMIGFRAKFQNYKLYANATIDKMFTEQEMKNVLIVEANYFSHALIRNMGGGKFETTALPSMSQFSSLNGMIAEDFDGDGNLDLLAAGNDYSTEVSIGRYDASNGLFMKGDGNGGFIPFSILKSGWFLPGNGKAIVKFQGADGRLFIAASQNRGPLKISRVNKELKTAPVGVRDVAAIVELKNGKKERREINYGSSYLSQSGRFLILSPEVSKVYLIDALGNSKEAAITINKN